MASSGLDGAWRQHKFAEHMLKETGGKCSKCLRVGRRASSMARGELASMIKGLRHIKSKMLQTRVGKLELQDCNLVLHNFVSVGIKVEEELLEKFDYHQKLLPLDLRCVAD